MESKKSIIEASLKKIGQSRKTLEGAGRKPLSETLDNMVLLEWICERREKNLRVSPILIMKK